MPESPRYGPSPPLSPSLPRVGADECCRFTTRRNPCGSPSTAPHPNPPNVSAVGPIPKTNPPDMYATPYTLATAISNCNPFGDFQKSANRNSWFKTITSSFMNGSGSPRTPSPQLDAPTHIRQPSRSLVDPKFFASRAVKVADPRLPDHMRRPELQLRRIQRRELPSSKSLSNRSGSVDRIQKYPHWWPA